MQTTRPRRARRLSATIIAALGLVTALPLSVLSQPTTVPKTVQGKIETKDSGKRADASGPLIADDPLVLSYEVPDGMARSIAPILQKRFRRPHAIMAYEGKLILVYASPQEQEEIARVLRKVLVAIAPSEEAARTDAEAAKKPPMKPAEFVEAVASVIEQVHESYVVEIDKVQLLRWAVTGIYFRRGMDFPEEIAEQIEDLRGPGQAQIRAVLSEVARDCKDDLRGSTDLAFDQILRHLDEACDILESDRICILRDYYPTGIGLRLAKDRLAGTIRVALPFRGGPAYKAGLRSGDVGAARVSRSSGPTSGSASR
jgi:hypothetical protein